MRKQRPRVPPRSPASPAAGAAIAAKLQLAVASHQQGQLAMAESLYREIIAAAPAHFDALHLLGVIAAQTGHFAGAVDLIGRAIRVNPGNATAHANLGNALKELDRQEEALASYDRALRLKPDLAEVLNNRGEALNNLQRHAEALPRAVRFDEVIARWPDAVEPRFTRLPFDHPLYILYSSGTTGLPKCIVHGAGGTLLQHWKELALHTNVRSNDVVFYFTTCGWMMWNWLVSTLALGATIVLYDGAPLSPNPAMLWLMASIEGVTVFGTSAKYLSTIEKEGMEPGARFNLSRLQSILSTGSPLAEHSYDFVYRAISRSVRLCSISGGTDIVSCFALGDPTGPVYRGELQMRGLGMDVDVVDERGQPVREQPGELICRSPFPSMPVAFWNDPAGRAYRAAYFEHLPGVWRHGDWAEITRHDGLVIHGRSDATLNPGGVRIGTAEIYRQVEQIDGVLESIVIEQRSAVAPDESRVVLFVRLRDDVTLDETLTNTIRQRIRAHASPHHVPRVVVAVRDIPRTISGKITELAVRDVVHGRPVRNTDALANPEALALYRDLPELAGY